MMLTLLLAGCTGMPENVTPVSNFDGARYLGKWYEIARLDHSFERGLTQVTAQYSQRDDGGIRVINRGFNAAKGAWKEAEGKAYFVDQPDAGYLKVSFFGPFYGAYVVFDLDQQHYRHAMISGPNTSYLWILSRTPTLDATTTKRLVDKAQALGFDTSKLVYVDQQPAPRPISQ
ncbi:MAG: lipocalin family protein [Telluria sp.]